VNKPKCRSHKRQNGLFGTAVVISTPTPNMVKRGLSVEFCEHMGFRLVAQRIASPSLLTPVESFARPLLVITGANTWFAGEHPGQRERAL